MDAQPEQPTSTPAPTPSTMPMPQATAPAPAPVTAAARPQSSPDNKHLKIIAFALGAVIVVLAIVVVFFIFNQQEQKRLAPRPITVSISADGYSAECTKIPVAVSGTDSKGAAVDTTVFIDEAGTGAKLAPGEYDLSFPASPLTPDGILYRTPDATDHIIIEKDSEKDAEVHAFENDPVIFTKTTALSESDEMINEAYDYAIKDESQVEKADELKQVALDAHQKAVGAENARREMEAARTIEMPLYTVKIPEYWVGKVDIIKDGNDLKINAKGYSDGTLLFIECVPSSYEINQGDIGTSLVQYANTSNGYRAEMYMKRWTWIAGSPYSSSSEKTTDVCVQLETGGALTAAGIRSATRSGNSSMSESEKNPYVMRADEYVNSNVVLTSKNGSPTKKLY